MLLALSVAHFAEGEAAFAPQRDGRSRDRADSGAGWSIGLAMVGAPLLAHPGESVHLLRLITGWSPALPAAPARDALLAGLVAGAGITVAALVRAGRRVQAVEVALTVLVGMVAPPGVAFGVSFAAVHSAHHLGRLADLRSHRPQQPSGIGAPVTGSLLPLVVSAAGGVTCWAVTGAPVARIVLGAILALTVPHAIVVAGTMDGRRWRRRHISAHPRSPGHWPTDDRLRSRP
jgi:Brp/Blh family beta-carotene 15,15'-monooxygenase